MRASQSSMSALPGLAGGSAPAAETEPALDEKLPYLEPASAGPVLRVTILTTPLKASAPYREDIGPSTISTRSAFFRENCPPRLTRSPVGGVTRTPS